MIISSYKQVKLFNSKIIVGHLHNCAEAIYLKIIDAELNEPETDLIQDNDTLYA